MKKNEVITINDLIGKMLDKKVKPSLLGDFFKDILGDILEEYTTNDYFNDDDFKNEFITELLLELKHYNYYDEFYSSLGLLVNQSNFIMIPKKENYTTISSIINDNVYYYMYDFYQDVNDILDDIFTLYYASYIPSGMMIESDCKRSYCNVILYVCEEISNLGYTGVYSEYDGLSLDTLDDINDDVYNLLKSVKPLDVDRTLKSIKEL